MILVLQIAGGVLLGLFVWSCWSWVWPILAVVAALAAFVWLVANFYNRVGPRVTRRLVNAQVDQPRPRTQSHELTDEDREIIRRIAAGEDVLPPKQ